MCAGDFTPEDKYTPDNYSINELWIRGRYWEIFGFADGSFTAFELAQKYTVQSNIHQEQPDKLRLIDDAFATPLTEVILIVKNLLTVVIYFSHLLIESE